MTDQVQQQDVAQEAPAPVILTFQMSLDNVNALLGFLSSLSGVFNVLGFLGVPTTAANQVSTWVQIIRAQAMQQVQAMNAQAQAAQTTNATEAPATVQ